MITVTTDYAKRREAAAIPGCHYDADIRGWVIAPDAITPGVRTMLTRAFPEVVLPEGDTSPAQDALRPLDLATEWAGDRLPHDLLPNTPLDVTAKLYRYQAVDLGYLAARLKQDGCGYVGWTRGLGKTLGAQILAREIGANKIVVIGPNASKESVWRPEIDKWGMFPYFEVYNLKGSKTQRDRTIANFKREKAAFLLVHYEALRLVDWSRVKVDMVICDEAHRLSKGSASTKSPQFYKALKTIKAPYRLALSGSVIVNTPEDLFGALHWLAPDRYRSKWKDWNNRFMRYVTGAWGTEFIGLKTEKLPEMQRELGALLCVRRKEDELTGLPERIEQTIEVEIEGEQRRMYEEMRDRFITEYPDGETVMAPVVIAQLTRLRQIATAIPGAQSAKIDMAVDLITDNLPKKTVVFAWHKSVCEAMADALHGHGITATVVHGDVSNAERTRRVDLFQRDPECKVLIATMGTLAEAVTLNAADDLIFLEQSWVPKDMDQAADRVGGGLRSLGKARITVTKLVAANTVDTLKLLPTIKSKQHLAATILGGRL